MSNEIHHTGPPSNRRRLFRVLLLSAGILAVGVLGAHLWFVRSARGVLEDMVATRSEGTLQLELSELGFDLFARRIKVRQASLVTVDSTARATTYNVKFRQLTLRLGSFWSLLLRRNLVLDSIDLSDPHIEVVQWRRDTASAIARDELSIPQAMGKLYNSMLDALDDYGIRRITIRNATLSLVNKLEADARPVTISGISFELLRTLEGGRRRDEYIEKEQSVDLRTTHQNFTLPGGRHRLSFRNFHLELFRQRILLDSCTLTAIATDSTRSSYTIFFDKLLLIGVDFGAMYRQNLIRADSVYCENPSFDINLARGDAAAPKKERPDPEKIVRELAGDLDLAFVGVKDAGIHITISGSATRTLFNSSKDDFEMRGLRINVDSARPVVVDRFDMLVRDYRLYNEDSSTAYSFDSIRFSNNRMLLSNFSVETSSSPTRLRDERDIRIPYFQLTGVDWYELLFEQGLKAEEAVLYNPVINYIKRPRPERRRRSSLFATLQSMDSLLTLNRTEVVNGQISMRLGRAASLDLRGVNLALNSNRLMQSTSQEGVQRSVEELSFKEGTLRLRDLSVHLQGVQTTAGNSAQADRIRVEGERLNAIIDGVHLHNLSVDDKTETVVADGVHWQRATVALQGAPAGRKGRGGPGLHLKNITGGPTEFRFSDGTTKVTTALQSLSLASLDKTGEAPIEVTGLAMRGRALALSSGALQLKADAYRVVDGGASLLSGLQVERLQGRDTLSITVPQVLFTTDIDQLSANRLHLASLEAHAPVIVLAKGAAADSAKERAPGATIRIDRFTAHEPVVRLTAFRGDSVTRLHLPPSAGSSLTASGLELTGAGGQLEALSLKTGSATYAKGNGEVLGVDSGKVEVALSNIRWGRKEGKPSWSGRVESLYLQNPNSMAFGKKNNRLVVEQAALGNLALSSDYLTDFRQLIRFNLSAWLRTTTGLYTDSLTTLKWYNAGYESGSRTLRLDSFVYYPTQPRDSVIARAPYQKDYATFRSGAIELQGFDLAQYEKDSALVAHTITVTRPVITLYRDKLPPRRTGIIKPLPTDMLQRIGLPVGVQQVNIIDGELTYTEKHASSRAEGTLLLARINGGLRNVKNRNIARGDSLELTLQASLMDSATLNLTVNQSYTDSLNGFLMTLSMRPTTLTFLNPVLVPLSNMTIASGTVDSFFLRAIGTEELALGSMHMYYHDLRIKLIKDGDPTRRSFTDRVATVLANAFLIRTNNDGRPGLVYFERLRDRSFFNYIVKMTFSGMAASIGVKSNRRYIKQYRRALEERGLPPIQME